MTATFGAAQVEALNTLQQVWLKEKIVNEAELAKVNSFVSIVRDESHPTLAQSKMLISAPASWQRDPQILLRKLDVFDQGLRLKGN
jgi:hypothetical protein